MLGSEGHSSGWVGGERNLAVFFLHFIKVNAEIPGFRGFKTYEGFGLL